MGYNPQPPAINDWADLAIGESGDLDTERNYLRVMQKAYQIFCKKHHDYGHQNLSRSGLRGIEVRVGDKLARLKNALDSGKELKVAESLVDTLIDASNYMLIGALMLLGQGPVFIDTNLEDATKPACEGCPYLDD